ncbi:farnesol dehydrogenase-like [Photinus pyralis]|uniref:Uncharacterized protein n=1 Tax=Photinus pyralis TaxID=7054 RepID=A0A1Y1LW42_PHOPY|nr:farnesol dehydrogenase-like [Photinus pyralis]
MNRWNGKVAVVTGASSGIGASIATHLVNSGLLVVGVARRKDHLEELQKKLGEKFSAVFADVGNEKDVFRLFSWITQNIGVVHVLVNCAGVFRPKGLLDGETSDWVETFDTNVVGLCVVTREAVTIMRANGVDGHIVHISGLAGHYVVPLPYMNVYSASKFGVRALTETLRQELIASGSKIKVSSVSPGFVLSEMTSGEGAICYQDGTSILAPEDVAEAVLYVLGSPAHVQVHELIIRPVGQIF